MAAHLVPSFSFQSALSAAHPDALDTAPSSEQLIAATLSNSAHTFLKPPPTLHAAALALAKRYLDPLASSVSAVQHARLQAARKTRKRGDEGGLHPDSVLRLKEVHLEGLSLEQVWEQARRVLDATCKELEGAIGSEPTEDAAVSAAPATENGSSKPKKGVRFVDQGSPSSSELEVDGQDISEDGEANDFDADSDGASPVDGDSAGNEEPISGELVDGAHEDGFENIEERDGDEEVLFEDEQVENDSRFVKDKYGLNDGFFSIDDFNQHTEFLEQQDARGDPNDGAASDEEDVDWENDPLSQPLPAIPGTSKRSQVQRRRLSLDSERDGPTFGNADLNAPWSSGSDDEGEDDDVAMDDDPSSNANEIYYADFFAPPPRAASKSKRRPLPKTQPPSSEQPRDFSPTDQEISRTIASAHRDIFSDASASDLSEASDPDPSNSVTSKSASKSQNLSSHEKRQAALATQIRQLEAQAIAKRQWTLAGEARAADRPVNSLLEEDLDFERAGKPVPVATAATSSALEELIKRRILDRQFDEVHRRRPGLDGSDPLANGPGGRRRGLLEEVSDRRPEQGLAELYETEHARLTDPNFVDKRTEGLKRAHAEIEALWRDVSGKLDALSSWHYRPKPADVSVSVVSDAPRVVVEDARPAGVGIGGEESGLAPQEVYRVGEGVKVKRKKGGREGGEGEGDGRLGEDDIVVTSGGGVVGREELSREQKLRRRRRDKERARKREKDAPPATLGAGARAGTEEAKKKTKQPARSGKVKGREQKNILDELKRGDVKVIGKGGELRGVQGQAARIEGDNAGREGRGRALKL